LNDRNALLNTQLDQAVNDANVQILSLQNKMSGIDAVGFFREILTNGTDMVLDHERLRCKNDELVQAYREKSRKQLQTQDLYDKLKRREMLGQLQDAAGDTAAHTSQVSATANRFVDRQGNQNQRPNQTVQPPHLFNAQSSGVLQAGVPRTMDPSGVRAGASERTWAGFSSQGGSQRKLY
jgi:E3 ubiquitin-protein ligase CCNP1IP1